MTWNTERVRKFYKGRCWICGLSTWSEKKTGRNHKLNPTIDHVVTEDGQLILKLAHGICNTRRGAARNRVTEHFRERMRQSVKQLQRNESHKQLNLVK